MKIARLGVLLDRSALEQYWQYGINSFQGYVTEILSHVGIPFELLDRAEQISIESFDVVIAAVTGNDQSSLSHLYNYITQGGILIAYGGLNEWAGKLNAVQTAKSASGYAYLSEKFGEERPLRFLQSEPWLPMENDESCTARHGCLKRQQPTGEDIGNVLLEYAIGQGTFYRWAVDIPATVAQMQQGVAPILNDGAAAPDGSAPLNEGILKADDSFVMNWELDRLATETGQPYFAHPYADLWREIMITHLIQAVVQRRLTLPFIGYWPDGIDHVAMISHDSDLNSEAAAETTLRLLNEQGIRSCWCMIEPGYSEPMYKKIQADGHELAFHYNGLAEDSGLWGRDEFHRQFNWLKDAVQNGPVVSNKNHYTRMEGWGELFVWCEETGIQADQTRGPSKRGNVGFLFGTCHPYFPIAWWNEQNRLYNVLEIGFLTQDINIGEWADMSVVVPFLEQVIRVQGVAHFLFHQHHLHFNSNAALAFQVVVDEAKKRGFPFWTSAEINHWERTRRKAIVRGLDAGGKPIWDDKSMCEIPTGLVVWVPLLDESPQENVQYHFGIPCKKHVIA